MKRLLLFSVLISFSVFSTAVAQDTLWTHTYGDITNDMGNSVQQTSDEGYIIASTGYANLVKVDADGEFEWIANFGMSAEYAEQTDDGGYIVIGSNGGIYLVKTNSSGDAEWTSTFGGLFDYGWGGQQTSDGGYIIIAGGFFADAITLIKTDSNGDEEWTATFGNNTENVGNSVRQTPDGGYIITGYTGSPADGYDLYLLKTDTNGAIDWEYTYGGDNNDYGESVQQASDGGYIVAGYSNSFGGDDNDLYIVKTSANGDTLWTRIYGGNDEDYGYSVCETSDEGYVVAGRTLSFGGSNEVYLVKTDANGDEVWSENYGRSEEDVGHWVSLTDEGHFIVAGYTNSIGAGESDIWLLKIRGIITGVNDGQAGYIPSRYGLFQNYPNPFNVRTIIKFDVPAAGNVVLEVYNILGQKVETLINDRIEAGNQSVAWDASVYSSGVYFYRLAAGDYVNTRKMNLIK